MEITIYKWQEGMQIVLFCPEAKLIAATCPRDGRFRVAGPEHRNYEKTAKAAKSKPKLTSPEEVAIAKEILGIKDKAG